MDSGTMRSLLAFFIFLSIVSCSKSHEIILSSLSESQANDLVVALSSQGIQSEKVADKIDKKSHKFAIAVVSEKKEQALRILSYNFLPAPKSNDFKNIYTAENQGIIPSQQYEQARFQMALQGEIENMLLILPGVMKAKVTLVLPKNIILANNEAPKLPSASVAIVYNPLNNAEELPLSATDIQALVSAAVLGLTPDRVAVLMKENQAPSLIADSVTPISMSLAKEITPANLDLTTEKLNRSRKLNIFLVLLVFASTLIVYAQVRQLLASQRQAEKDKMTLDSENTNIS